MDKHHTKRPLNNSSNKDSIKLSEQKTTHPFLQEKVLTASMIKEGTGIKQKNICDFKSNLEKEEKRYEIVHKSCTATGSKASNAPITKYIQLKLWEGLGL